MNGRKRKYRNLTGILSVIVSMQILDTYCMDLQGKLQSFALDDFLISGRGMTAASAVAYMNIVMMPFILLSSLAPFVRILSDKLGRNKVFIGNILLLILGCLICFYSNSITLYLLGWGIINFCCSVDIQFIYLVEMVPYRHHGAVKGILLGIAGMTAVMISLLRFLFVTKLTFGWKFLFGIGGGTGVVVLLLSAAVLTNRNGINVNKIKCNGDSEKKKLNISRLKSDKKRLSLLLNMLVLGMATAGITLYNEPFVKFAGISEEQMQIVLYIQPPVMLVAHVISGLLVDIWGRNKMLIGNIVASIMATILFIYVTAANKSMLSIGITWGAMLGCYFNAEGILQLVIMEHGNKQKLGYISALTTIAYGIGDGIAMIIFSLAVKAAGLSTAKMLLSVPPLIAALLIFVFRSRKIINDMPFVCSRKDDKGYQ